MSQNHVFMQQAFAQAMRAFDQNEVPVGCVIVKEGRVIGRGYNQMETLKDPTAHAEILAIGAAATHLGDWRLDGCTLYATLEPCPMCAGAILNSRISEVVYAAEDKRLGACGSVLHLLNGRLINRSIPTTGGIMRDDALALIQDFFKERRKFKKQAPPAYPESLTPLSDPLN